MEKLHLKKLDILSSVLANKWMRAASQNKLED